MHTREQPSLPMRPVTDRELDEVLASLEAELLALPSPQPRRRDGEPRDLR